MTPTNDLAQPAVNVHSIAVGDPTSVGTKGARTQNRVFIDAAAQLDNFGDDIIVRQLLRLMERRAELSVDVRKMPRWAIEVVDVDPGQAQAKRGFAFRLLGRGLRSRFGRHSERVFLVLKPGHINGSYTLARVLARVGLLGLTALCRLVGVHVVRVGFSVDDLRPPMLQIERLQARLQTVYAPRDRISENYAASVGIKTTDRSTDLAYTLGVQGLSGEGRNGVVLCFAATTDGHPQPAYADTVYTLINEFIGQELAVGTPVTWCAQVTRDMAFRDRVLSDHPQVPTITFDRSLADGDRIFELYQGSEVVLTNRLHSFLLSLSQGSLAVVVSNPATHGKIVGLIQEMGLTDDLLLPIDGLTPDALRAHIDRLVVDRERVISAVADYFAQQTELMESLMDDWLGSPTVQTPQLGGYRSRHYRAASSVTT